mmetsp:Transcript_56339/g.123424  ORF Transcript_56339/g.123424 Transcript_56339/m.123424 type:complete len:282 (+) Transcript_56339:304-1149(+)
MGQQPLAVPFRDRTAPTHRQTQESHNTHARRGCPLPRARLVLAEIRGQVLRAIMGLERGLGGLKLAVEPLVNAAELLIAVGFDNIHGSLGAVVHLLILTFEVLLVCGIHGLVLLLVILLLCRQLLDCVPHFLSRRSLPAVRVRGRGVRILLRALYRLRPLSRRRLKKLRRFLLRQPHHALSEVVDPGLRRVLVLLGGVGGVTRVTKPGQHLPRRVDQVAPLLAGRCDTLLLPLLGLVQGALRGGLQFGLLGIGVGQLFQGVLQGVVLRRLPGSHLGGNLLL